MNKISTKRLLSLDVFRGITIALMILVNSQAVLQSYPIMAHAEWDGCTFADLVFPFFLFIVGLTTVISLKKHKESESYHELHLGIIKRSLMLFALGIFLNVFPYSINFETIRIYGILQRIAVCYFVCACLYLHTSYKSQFLWFGFLLIGYYFLMLKVPVPGYGAGVLTPEGSWVSYLDLSLFSPKHLFESHYDPEGFLSTFPAIGSTLAGLLTGHYLISKYPPAKKWLGMLFAGCFSLLVSWIWSSEFPINKNLWSSSYVMWTSGWALILFSSCYGLIDILDQKKWTYPFKVFGVNAIAAFVLHVLLLKLQYAYKIVSVNGAPEYSIRFFANYLFGYLSPENAALMYSITFLFLNFGIIWLLYKRNIYIKL